MSIHTLSRKIVLDCLRVQQSNKGWDRLVCNFISWSLAVTLLLGKLLSTKHIHDQVLVEDAHEVLGLWFLVAAKLSYVALVRR